MGRRGGGGRITRSRRSSGPASERAQSFLPGHLFPLSRGLLGHSPRRVSPEPSRWGALCFRGSPACVRGGPDRVGGQRGSCLVEKLAGLGRGPLPLAGGMGSNTGRGRAHGGTGGETAPRLEVGTGGIASAGSRLHCAQLGMPGSSACSRCTPGGSPCTPGGGSRCTPGGLPYTPGGSPCTPGLSRPRPSYTVPGRGTGSFAGLTADCLSHLPP